MACCVQVLVVGVYELGVIICSCSLVGVATAQHVKTIQSENAGRNWPRAHDLSMFCFPSLIVIGFVWRKHPVHRCPVMQTKER